MVNMDLNTKEPLCCKRGRVRDSVTTSSHFCVVVTSYLMHHGVSTEGPRGGLVASLCYVLHHSTSLRSLGPYIANSLGHGGHVAVQGPGALAPLAPSLFLPCFCCLMHVEITKAVTVQLPLMRLSGKSLTEASQEHFGLRLT